MTQPVFFTLKKLTHLGSLSNMQSKLTPFSPISMCSFDYVIQVSTVLSPPFSQENETGSKFVGTFGPSNRSRKVNFQVFISAVEARYLAIILVTRPSTEAPLAISMAEAPGSLRDGEIARAGSCNSIPSGNDIETWKRQRKATRKQVTTTCRQIDSLIISHGSRGSIMGLIDHLGLLSSTATRLHTDLLNAETDKTENERQDAIHLRYIQQIGETRESARQYLESRANEPPSEIRVIAAQPVYSLAPSLIGERPEVAGAAELAVAQQRAHEARMQADAARTAAEEAERDLQRLSVDDRESFSSAHYYNPIATRNVADWLLHPRTKFAQPPATNVEAPDD
ncbi:hypothetical protein OUZ56_024601 [Daphnia magna]|uniref:Uncharacterized protein n=1 Tax=Daphnia magna TaxID=35525 RepID=A0ABR0B117_9CRUS|nr:hypothetical protein OUZ56_024601 [Daphnia magna]